MREDLVKSEEFKYSLLGKIPKEWNKLALAQRLMILLTGALAADETGLSFDTFP